MKDFFKRLFNSLKEVDTGRLIVGILGAGATIGETIYMVKDSKKEREQQAETNKLIAETVRNTTNEYLDNLMKDDDDESDEED